jgi:YVTN family beta-propeller protein
MMAALWSRLSTSSRWMCVSLALGLGCVLFSGCPECDTPPKGSWVACIGNKPTLMIVQNGAPVPFDTTDTSFDPSKWDCSNPNSPPAPNPGQPDYKTGTRTGPTGIARPRKANAAASNPPSVFLPRQLLSLPFLPQVPAPATPPGCDASFPDVITVNHPLGIVTRISTCPFTIKAAIPVVTRPLQIVITPDGATALVTSFDNAVNFIDLATNKVTFTLKTDFSINPNGIAISPDGTRAYITSFNNTNAVVLVVDLGTRTVLTSIPVDTYPLGAFLTPDGSQLWVTFPFGQAVYVIDTLSNAITTLLAIPQSTGVAFNSTGSTAYITSASGPPGAVVAVDTARYQVVKSYTVGVGPTDIAMAYADQFLVVNNNAGGSVSVINLSTGTVKTAAIGSAPKGISFVK